MHRYWYRALQFIRFYRAAETRYQVHSPFVFEWVDAVLEDERWYYAFEDIEAIRDKMLNSTVEVEVLQYNTASGDATLQWLKRPLRQIARLSASAPAQGRRLFRLAQWLKPERMLELGTSVGIGALYLGAAARRARFITLEGSEACTHVARANLGILGLNHQVEVVPGLFQDTLPAALNALGEVDIVFFDGNHRHKPTLEYLDTVLRHVHDRSVLVFDDIYWSPEMTAAWEQIRQHPRITLTVDCYDLAFAFVNPDFKAKQHLRLVPRAWKPWKIW